MGPILRRSGVVLMMMGFAAAPAAAQPAAPTPRPSAPPESSSSPGPPAPATSNAPAAPVPSAGDARPAPLRVTLPDPVLTCKTLSELLLWDNKETDGAVLRRTMTERTCRNLPGGTAVSVAETATIKGTAYQCLIPEGESDCVWAGAVDR